MHPLSSVATAVHCSPSAQPDPLFRIPQTQVTLRCGGCKPLVIKSPTHTARVRLLLRLFPRARFVYLHR